MTLTPSLVWLGVCVTLVLLLQVGLGLMYAGSARAKDAVNVLMQALVGGSAVALLYWAVGDALAMGDTAGGWFGTGRLVPAPSEALPALTLLLRIALAATAFVIVCGAIAERLRASASLLFAVVIGALLYPVLAHWSIYPQGWLRQLGLVDAGGAASLHALAGWCALAGAMVLGPRLGRYGEDGSVRAIPGHHLPMTVIGAWIAGIGWVGLHAGTAQLGSDAAGAVHGAILLNTVLAGAAGALVAVAGSWHRGGDARVRSIVNGLLGGLVGISAGAATMSAPFAALTGALAGWLVNAGAARLRRLQIDDASDAVSVHGLCSVWALMAAGLFHEGDAFSLDRVLVQGLAALAAFAWTLPVAYVALRGIDRIRGLRVSSTDEMRGADYSQQRAQAYPEFKDGLARLRQECA